MDLGLDVYLNLLDKVAGEAATAEEIFDIKLKLLC